MKNRSIRLALGLLLSAGALTACEQEDPLHRPTHAALAEARAALSGEDGLAEAYQIFQQRFVAEGRHERFPIGFGFHPGIVTTRVAVDGKPAGGTVTLDFVAGRIQATLSNVPASGRFDLWLVKNVEGPGRTVRPEVGDQLKKVGTFGPSTQPATQQLDVAAGPALVGFDLDQVVITRKGKRPEADVVATGARTLFEKRFFRERAGLALDPVTGTLLLSVETGDTLVARGAHLFFNETFGGNGRTCGTCHRAEENLTISPAFIATLPQDDPLFVAENVPELAERENSTLLRFSALIKENVDGLEDPTVKFVLRSVPHTLAMSTSIGTGELPTMANIGTPPDFRTGWSADGSPGRGSLNEFAFGAIIQHFTRRLERVPGVDFRLPTQAELDALEAFQLFSGRQKNPQTASITFKDARAENGKNLFLNQGVCVACHRDLVAGNENFVVDTDIERILIAAPRDGGFGTTGTDTQGGIGNGRFNVPPLVEAADTGPFFHNNTINTIEEAVAFYTSDVFFFSPGHAFTGNIVLDATQIDDIGAFLRVINAAENIRQARKRAIFVLDHRSPGNDDILRVAIADLGDAVEVLEQKGLHPATVKAARTARQTLEIALANPDGARPAYVTHALQWLAQAKPDLFAANPLDEF